MKNILLKNTRGLSNIGKEAALNQLLQTGSKEFEDLYYKYLLFEARNYQVDSGLLYLEKNRILKERFYQPRRNVFLKHNIIGSLQDLMDDKLDICAERTTRLRKIYS